jgi:carbamoyltransferase
MKIIGISAFYHDSAACLIDNGEIISAVHEERFTRIKHDASFPKNSIKYLLEYSNLSGEEIDHIIFYEKPFIKFERLLETILGNIPFGFKIFRKAIPVWLKEKLFQKKILVNQLVEIDKCFKDKEILFCDHHISHASSSFFTSNFEEAIILTIDGVGEKNTTTISKGFKNKVVKLEEINFPHSIGLLYSAFTYYLGFKVNSGEYKVMGLAPYGKPVFKDTILNNLIDLKEDGSFKLNLKYFEFNTDLKMTNNKFSSLFGKKNRNTNDQIEDFHMNVAASIQIVLEEVLLKICKYINRKYKIKNLCLAGGVALNCVANSKILETKLFDKIWIQPAAGDAGGSLGCALYLWYNELNNQRVYKKNSMKGSLLGPSFSNEQIEKELNKLNANYEQKNSKDILRIAAKELSKGKIIGWFQNRMEFGPRALGARSIIADPRNTDMQKNLNLKIKFRESFRPFAPSVLKEHSKDWFKLDIQSPYMLFTSQIAQNKLVKNETNKVEKISQKINNIRSAIPAVTHVDNSARFQTIEESYNKKFYDLILEFYKETKCPILINTSFNVRGEPIVLSPEDAYNCFLGTGIDILILEDFILYKSNQLQKDNKDYLNKFELD